MSLAEPLLPRAISAPAPSQKETEANILLSQTPIFRTGEPDRDSPISVFPAKIAVSHARGTSSSSLPGTGTESVPPSFKSAKVRKNKSFIGSVKQSTRLGLTPECSAEALHPGLEEDGDITHILQKVATLIFGHVKDGQDSEQGAPSSGSDDEFDESNFLAWRCRCSCFPRKKKRRDPVTFDAVLALITDIATSLYFCKQIIVLSAIYLERLMTYAGTTLTAGNWRSVVVVALMIASKVWEDIHPWNADFEECMEDVAGLRYQPKALYRLESLFLDKLQWRVFVDGEVYAAYFFALLEDRKLIDGAPSPRRHRRDRQMSTPLALSMECIHEDILEDLMDFDGTSSDGDRISESLGQGRMHAVSSASSFMSSSRSHTQIQIDSMDSATFESRLASVRIMHEAWRLDSKNPLVGAFRHAPRALAPSRHIRSSDQLLWEHKLAARTVEVLGPPRIDSNTVATLSGATGTQLASELRRFLGKPQAEEEPPGGDLDSLSFG